MAHRRKSSNPLCKQKRISSVVDRVLAAKLQEQGAEKEKIFYGRPNDSDNKSASDSEASSTSKHILKEKARDDQNIAIPVDLLGEFKALQAATNLDTATLMRRLIQEYSHTSSAEKTSGGSRLTSQLFDVSIQSYDRDRGGQNEYEYERPNLSPAAIVDKNRQSSSMPNKSVIVQRNPSPSRMYHAEPYYWSDENCPSYKADDRFPNGCRSSMKVPTVVREQNSDSSSDNQSFLGNSRPRSRQSAYSPSAGSESSLRNKTQDHFHENHYPNGTPSTDQQEAYTGMSKTSIRDNGSVSSAFPLVASLCDENGVIISPKQNEEAIDMEQKMEEMKFSQEIISQTDAHMAMQALNPHGITAKLQKASGKNNAKKGQMKLIAENTSNHGVYTSVLKLPWSRRTRTPKNDPSQAAKHPDKDQKDTAPSLSDVSYEEMEGQLDVNNHEIKTEPMDEFEKVEIPESPVPMTPQPYMLVPVPGMPSSQNGIFVPTGSMPLTSEAQTNGPMMMVYPNASFANVGRPARKRGRPPKVPVLTRMLSDTSKVPRFEFPVTSFFPQFAPCPQPAIVLNVNNMMNTGNVGNATNNTNANVNTTTATNVVESNIQNVSQGQNQQHENGELIKTSSFTSEAISLNVPVESHIYNNAEQNIKVTLDSATISHQNMTTTSSTENQQTGAIFQEMILSSQSLVNVRPRKRQSTTEMLKAKSTPANDFICTSFKLRNMNKPGKEKKKSPWVPGMKRRGRPPKKKMDGMDGNILNPEHFMSATIHHFPQGVVPSTVQPPEVYNPHLQTGQHVITPQITPNDVNNTTQHGDESDSNESSSASVITSEDDKKTSKNDDKDEKDMFQQLFHCKICNEIVPIEKRDKHREKHVHVKYFCNKCETARLSYVQKDDITNNECIDKLLKCAECTDENDPSSSPSFCLVCMMCDERFLKFSALEAHKQSAHQNALDKDFLCSECDKSFVSLQKLKLHQQLCHEVRYHTCPYRNCQKVYNAQHKLQNHIRKRHRNNLMLRCVFDGCKEMFSNHGALEEHIKTKHYSVKGYTCSKPGCDEEFSSERDLKFHLLLHNDSDSCTFECEICDYRCHQQQILDWHMKNLHPETELKNEHAPSEQLDSETM